MVNYKLYYFPSRGRAEYVRYLFAYAGVEYEDIRVKPEEWTDFKPKMPFGQMPALEIDGKFYAQSYAICRYLAKKFDLMGNNLEDGLRIDMIVDCQEDFNLPLIGIAREKDEKEKEVKKKKFLEEQQPYFMEKFDTILKENQEGDGYFVGDEVTLADLAFYHGLSWPAVFGMVTPWDDYPKLKALNDKIENHPNIKAWIDKRPESSW